MAQLRVSLDKVLVVASPPVRPLGHALEPPQIQTPLERLVLLAGEIAGHDLLAKQFLDVDLEAVSPWKPRDNVRLAVLFRQVEHLVELPGELQ